MPTTANVKERVTNDSNRNSDSIGNDNGASDGDDNGDNGNDINNNKDEG